MKGGGQSLLKEGENDGSSESDGMTEKERGRQYRCLLLGVKDCLGKMTGAEYQNDDQT